MTEASKGARIGRSTRTGTARSPHRASDRTIRERRRATEIVDRFGRGALLPFQRAEDKRWFVGPDAESVVAYGLAGRVAVALGDPIGPDESARTTFDRFVAVCRSHRLVPVVYQATEAGRARLETAGFRCIPVGREAIIDLETFDLRGSRRANLRHTVTRAQRGGVRVEWRPDGLSREEIARLGPRLGAIDALWRRSAGPAMGFTISSFEAGRLMTTAVAIAFDGTGAPIAFATFARTGADQGWVLDLMRRLPESVPGALEWCIAMAASELRARGAPVLSLGLAPLWGLDRDAGSVEERLLARAVVLAAPFYDVAGLAFFKAKFDPRWETRYAAVRRTREFPALVLGLLKLHLVPPGGSMLTVVRDGLAPLIKDRAERTGREMIRAVGSGTAIDGGPVTRSGWDG